MIALFLAVLPLLAVAIPSFEIDYSHFHAKVKEIANTPLQPTQVMTAASTPLDCVFPEGAVMITYTSHYTTPFVEAQHHAMESSGLRECLESRFITACLDTKCIDFCKSSHIPNCVLIDFHDLPPSDFNKGEYRFFTYFKHELIYETLKYASHVFFFDADVVLFKNPFIEIQYGRDNDGKRLDGPYDLMFQRDRGRGPSCAGSVNSGQLYLRNSTAVQQYLANMRSMKDIILGGKNGLDQDFVANASESAGLKTCTLHPTLYTAHCYQIFGNIRYMDHGLPVKNIITYHTSCQDGLHGKLGLLNRVAGAVKSQSSSPILNVLRV